MSNQNIIGIHYLKLKDTKSFINVSPDSSKYDRLNVHLIISNFFGKFFFGKNKLLFHYLNDVNNLKRDH